MGRIVYLALSQIDWSSWSDVMADGSKLLVGLNPPEKPQPSTLTVFTNWQARTTN